MEIDLSKFAKEELLEMVNDGLSYAKKQRKQIDQLTNNWNELEEYIENESSKYVPTDPYIDGTNATYEEILEKMKEIKDGNNVSDRD